MADVATLPDMSQNKPSDDCEDVEKVLMVVVKRRKTIPTKCMEINKEISAYELQRLENAKIVTEGHKEKEKFRKMVQGFKTFKSFHVTLDDIYEAEKKLQKHYNRTKEIHFYLEKRKKLLK